MPLYNGGARAKKHIQRIATILNEEVNLILSDNTSTDGIVDEIESMHNEYIHIYRQKENIGSLRNAIFALEKGTGTYLMLLLDRDILQIEYLEAYLTFLREQKYGVILNMCQYLRNQSSRVLGDTERAYYLTIAPHPSYYVFLKSAFQQVKCTEQIKANGYYPALYALQIKEYEPVYLNGEIPIIVEAEKEYILMHASRSWGNSPRPYACGFEPEEYVLRFVLYLDYLSSIGTVRLEDMLGILKITLIGIAPGYMEACESPLHKHRYRVRQIPYAVEDYEQLLRDSYEKIIQILEKKGLWLCDWRVKVEACIDEHIREYQWIEGV